MLTRIKKLTIALFFVLLIQAHNKQRNTYWKAVRYYFHLILNVHFCHETILFAGNIALDNCGCCKVCLKQEHERCGGERNQYGRCDHHAKYCETFDRTGETRCMTLATGNFIARISINLSFTYMPKSSSKYLSVQSRSGVFVVNFDHIAHLFPSVSIFGFNRVFLYCDNSATR